MNRDIKFRVWSLKKKFFLLQDDDYHFYERSYEWECPISLSECLRSKEYVVQQYTGLKDTNNKEIYEGDIIAFSRLFERERSIKRLVSHVKFQDGRFGFDLTGFNGMFYNLYDEYNSEIIGNIFENPDLLE